jgi:hypothetical protein
MCSALPPYPAQLLTCVYCGYPVYHSCVLLLLLMMMRHLRCADQLAVLYLNVPNTELHKAYTILYILSLILILY